MYKCNDCECSFRDNAGSWSSIEDRDELIEDSILRCPECKSTDVRVLDEIEENDEENEGDPEYARLRALFPNSLLDY